MKNSFKKASAVKLIILVALTLFLLTGCIPGDGKADADNPAGFFWGIWHGWLAPLSLIIGIFKEGIRVYEVHNTGWWYDLGFYIAVISGFGGISFSRKKKKEKSPCCGSHDNRDEDDLPRYEEYE